MSENKGRTYETPRILTQAELILLEILKSQLKIEEAAIISLKEQGDLALTKYSFAKRDEIERQIEELTKPITRTLPEPF